VRILVIIGALLVGMIGLLMSACGGGYVIMFALSGLRGIRGPGGMSQAGGAIAWLVLSGMFLAVGLWLCRVAVRWMRGDRRN
jgi:hypothetical protein